MSEAYDALMLVSFGGPEGHEDVMPFLKNVLRGKPVPEERMMEVAEHYHEFDGVSPINEQNRQLIAALKQEMQARDLNLPVYYGNRNWEPFITEALTDMKEEGIQSSLAFFTSMYSCYSGCRQYRENIQKARDEVGEGAPEVAKLRMGFNHPGFIRANLDRLREAGETLGSDPSDTKILFTAHSIPLAMAENCTYEKQLRETIRILADEIKLKDVELVFQSRSGPPQQPWLEPDVCDRIEELAEEGLKELIIAPVGFISDHMEVLFDLDTEAAEVCNTKGIRMQRAATVGVHPAFVGMIVDLMEERMGLRDEKPALGDLGPWHDVCPKDCCRYQPRRPAPTG